MAKTVRTKKPRSSDIPENLKAMIPDAQGYVSRWITSEHRDLDLLDYFWKAKKNVILPGPSGSGKTSMLMQFAHLHDLPWVPVQCDGGATTDSLFGRFVPQKNGTLRWVDGPVSLAFRFGGMLYLDELNMLQPRIASALHSAFDFRRHLVIMEHPVTHSCHPHGHLQDPDGHEKCEGFTDHNGPLIIPAHPRLFVTAAYNPGYEGTRELNHALANRFIAMPVDYDPEVEKELITSPTLREFAMKLREQHAIGTITTPVSTNRLIDFEQHVEDLEYEAAKQLFLWNFQEHERGVVQTVLSDAMEAKLMDDFGFVYVEEG